VDEREAFVKKEEEGKKNFCSSFFKVLTARRQRKPKGKKRTQPDLHTEDRQGQKKKKAKAPLLKGTPRQVVEWTGFM